MKIILLGYMGSGKTGVGKLLSQKKGIPFLDLDSEITAIEKRDIPEIFKTSGEIYFRRKESEILQEILDSPDDLILSVGGGTPCYGKNLRLMRDSPHVILVYLKTSLAELTKRLFREKDQRPLISHLETEELLNDFIRKHLFERSFYYSQNDLTIETDGKGLEEVANELSGKLNKFLPN